MAFFKTKKNKTKKPEPKRTAVEIGLDYLHDVVYILAIVLVLFTFCVRVVIVSGSSMFSTLADGDCLLLLNRPLCGQLEQGDIARPANVNAGILPPHTLASAGMVWDMAF